MLTQFFLKKENRFLSPSFLTVTMVLGEFLAVQWLGLHTSTAGGPGLIPGEGPKIPQAT